MLFQKWIIINDLECIHTFQSSSAKDEIQFCWFPSSHNSLSEKKTILTFLKSKYPIAIGINEAFINSINEKNSILVEEITRLFFQTCYKKKYGVPYLIGDQNINFETGFYFSLTEFCNHQGLIEINHLFINSSNYFAIAGNLLSETHVLNELNSLAGNWIENVLSKNKIEQIPVFISEHLSSKDINKLDAFIASADKLIKQSIHFTLGSILIEQQEKNMKTKMDLQRSEKEKKDLQSYLTIQKGESKYLLQWYNREYEVLPLWYKQLGHIIKVFMGKRTLKSLFKK